MKRDLPILSIVIATHERPVQLYRCLSSIKRVLQEIPHEIILVSDCHSPATQFVVYKLLESTDTYIERTGSFSPALSRNVGFQNIKGEYVLIFDDDDELPAFEYQNFLEEALSRRGIVSFGDVIIAKEDRVKNQLTEDPLENPRLTTFSLDQIYIKNFIFTQATIFPASAIKYRLQDQFMRSLEDWEFLLNIKSQFDFQPITSVAAIIYKDFINLGNRRGSSLDARNYEVVLDYLYVYRRWPAPTEALKRIRRDLLAAQGLAIPMECL